MRLAVALVFAACNCATLSHPVKECETRCGLRGPYVNCLGLQEAEMAIIMAADRYSDYDAADVCVALKNWRVKVHDRDATDRERCRLGWWEPFAGEDMKGRCVSGLTHELAPYHVIELDSFAWQYSAFAHEVFHAVDIMRGKHTGPWHCAWRDLGRKDAIYEATGLPDGTVPEKDCP